MHVITWIYVIIAVVLLFGASVFVHEFGHFLAARRRGLKVEGFSIGFGPKIIGWTRDGIDYAWRWIPAGGFVKLPQMGPSELEGKSKEPAENLPPISPLSKILVALAGPVMNLALAFAFASALYVLGLPVPVNPSIIGEVKPDSPEAKLGILPGDRVVAVNGKRVKSWQDVQMITAMAPKNVLPVVIEHNGIPKTYELTAKINENVGLKFLDLGPKESPVIIKVGSGSAAEKGGLKAGDKVISFAGVPVVGQEQLVSLIKKRPEQPTSMAVVRGEDHLSLTVTPEYDPKTKAGLLGVSVGTDSTVVYELQRPGPLPWQLVGQVCQQTFDTLAALVNSRHTGVGVKDLSGPPGILTMLAVELKADYRLALKFMVLLNVSLAILNLLPLPVLDGGHILMAIVEKIRGRPINARIQEFATTAFAFLLITFMIYVSYNDVVKRFPLFRSLLHQEVKIEQGEKAPGSPAPVTP